MDFMDYGKFFKENFCYLQLKTLERKYKNKKVAVYGAGAYFKSILETYNVKLNIVAVCDRKYNDTKGEMFFSYPAISPEDLKTLDCDVVLVTAEQYHDIINYLKYEFLICTPLKDKDVEPIFQQSLYYDVKLFFLSLFEPVKYAREKKVLEDKYSFKKDKTKPLLDRYRQILIEHQFLKSIVDVKTLKPASGELREFQLKTFDFCYEILQQFEVNQIEYFLTCGSLLGAMRHKGFIPWDDDFDIGMMRKDYENLKVFCEQNFIKMDMSQINSASGNRFMIWNEYMQKYPNKIIYSLGPSNIQIFRGVDLNNYVNIDIFCHEYYADDYSIDEHRDYLSWVNRKRCEISNYKKMYEFSNDEISKNKNVVPKSNKICYSIDDYLSYYFNIKGFFTYDMIFPLKEAEFEGKVVYIPNNPDEYMSLQYKNYMEFPANMRFMEHRILRKIYTQEVLNTK